MAKKGRAQPLVKAKATKGGTPRPPKAAKALHEMDVDEFLSGDHLAPPVGAKKPAATKQAGKKQAGKKHKEEAAVVARSHASELEALKSSDPEFYKFLEENDRGLLEFEEEEEAEEEEEEDGGDEAKKVDAEGASSSEDGDEADDDADDDGDDAEDDGVGVGGGGVEEDDVDDEELGGKEALVLTLAKFEAFKAALGAPSSLRALKRLVILVRCACGERLRAPESSKGARNHHHDHHGKKKRGGDDDDDEEDEGEKQDEESDEEDEAPVRKLYEILDGAVRRDIVEWGLDELERRFRAVAGAKALSSASALRAVLERKKQSAPEAWAAKVEPLLAATLRGMLDALRSSDAASATVLQQAVAEKLAKYTAWLAVDPFREKLGSKFVRTLVALFARPIDGAGDDEDAERLASIEAQQKLQVETYCRLRELVAQERTLDLGDEEDASLQEVTLRKSYAAFARDVGPSLSKAVYAKRRAPSVAFVAACVAELYAEAPASVAYRSAFVYVRQLALTVRAALARRDTDHVAKVLCWRFLSAARCWTSVVARGGNAAPDRLGPLVFPLCQVLFGAVELAQSPRYAPLRLHCVAALHTIAAAAEVYVPTTAATLATLDECKHSRSSAKPSKKQQGAAEDWSIDLTIAATGDQLRQRSVSDALARYACDLLTDYLELIRYSPAVPELALVPMAALKRAAREQSASPNFKAATRSTIALLEAAADDVEKRRNTLAVAPKHLEGFEPLLPPKTPKARERLAAKQRDRARRRARLLEGAASSASQEASNKPKQQPGEGKKKRASPVSSEEVQESSTAAEPATTRPKKKKKATAEGVADFDLDDFLG